MAGFTAYTRATRWLMAQLTTPTTITGVGAHVYEDNAPEGETDVNDVWITFEAMDPGEDVAVINAVRIWTDYAFLVRAIMRGRSSQALEAIADEIDNRLQRKAGVVSDGRIIFCYRNDLGESEVPESWLRQGVEYRALGGIYNLIVQPL